MTRRITLWVLSMCLISNWLIGQTVWTEPFFPETDDFVTVYYDASEGDGGLADFSGDIYAHTGVITNLSNSPTDWRYVKSDWGIANPAVKMTSVGDDLYTIEFD
ncbi:MAG: alpha-amylase, partial [Bacteroidota bacterium]